jgi:hypothetical protein
MIQARGGDVWMGVECNKKKALSDRPQPSLGGGRGLYWVPRLEPHPRRPPASSPGTISSIDGTLLVSTGNRPLRFSSHVATDSCSKSEQSQTLSVICAIIRAVIWFFGASFQPSSELISGTSSGARHPNDGASSRHLVICLTASG